MNINKKKLFYTFLPLVLGFLVSSFINTYDVYSNLIKPSISPPRMVFPIVWSILYLIMGYSSYLISISKNSKKNESLYLYYLQLFVNLSWSFIFFEQGNYLLSFIWIVLLIVIVIIMIKSFYEINRLSAILNIPYLIWLLFACYLNFYIYLLN